MRAWLDDYAQDRGAFLLSMARNALSNAPPLGFVRDFAPLSRGEHAGTLDLKVNGVQLFVESARVYGLSRGVAATNTLERFAALVDAGALRADEVAEFTDAFRFIQRLRLQLNAAQRRRGEPLHNHLDPRDAGRRGSAYAESVAAAGPQVAISPGARFLGDRRRVRGVSESAAQ